MKRAVYTFGEMMPDSYGLDADILQSVINMRPAPDGYQPDTGFVSAGASTTSAVVIGAFEARYAGIGHELCGDATKLYSFAEEANPSFFDRSAAAYAAGDFWDFAQFGSQVVAVTGGTSTSPAPQVVTLPVTGNFAALGGSPPNAACCAMVREWLVLGHTYDVTDGEQYTRVRWSGNNQITQWPTDAATKAAVLSDWQDLKQDGGTVVRIIGGADALIFQHTTITRMTPLSDARQFSFDTISDRLGTRHARSVVAVGNAVYFWSGASFVRIGRDGAVAMIGVGKVDAAFKALVDGGADEFVECCGAYSVLDNSVAWIASQTSDVLYRYHIDYNRWTTLDLSVMGLAVTPEHLYTAKRGQQDSLIWLFASDKKLYRKSASSPFQIDTGEKRLNGSGRALVQLATPLQKGAVTSPGIAPLTRDKQDGSQSAGTAFSQHSDIGYFQGRSNARYHAFRYTGTYLTANQSVSGIEVHYVDAGQK